MAPASRTGAAVLAAGGPPSSLGPFQPHSQACPHPRPAAPRAPGPTCPGGRLARLVIVTLPMRQ